MIVGLLLFLINMDRLLQIVQSLWNELIAWIHQFIPEQSPVEPQSREEQPGGNAFEGIISDPQEPSFLLRMIETVFYYAAYIITILVIVIALYLFIYKIVIPLISRFSAMAKSTRELQVGYQDEEEKLAVSEFSKWFRGVIHRSAGQPKPRNNQERVKFLYKESIQSAIKNGYEFMESKTPLEIEQEWSKDQLKHRYPARLMSLYNKVRLGKP
jgi:hypothetical protein